MIKLNLIANGIEQERIKEYLENNASETLAEKINNGVEIVKDNKKLLNKKDLDGFWQYATNEAHKLANSNSRGAYVDDATVFGWAIHYFEEESIEGKLFNEDGTEYKVIKTTTPTMPKPTIKKDKPKEEKLQTTLFDMLTETPAQEENEIEKTKPAEVEIVKEDISIEQKEEKETPKDMAIDMETGEIISINTNESSFDKETMIMLHTTLCGKMGVQ